MGGQKVASLFCVSVISKTLSISRPEPLYGGILVPSHL